MCLITYAEQELDRIGMTADSDDEMNRAMREHLLHMVEEFSKEGHSGFSASYALGCLEKLLKFEPLSPLTGEDDEWNYIGDLGDDPVYQNVRCSRVFKGKDGRCWDIDGIVWYEWCCDGHKSYFTNKESKVYVEFPYIPKTEYREWIHENQAV
jgi:hypothetical protein